MSNNNRGIEVGKGEIDLSCLNEDSDPNKELLSPKEKAEAVDSDDDSFEEWTNILDYFGNDESKSASSSTTCSCWPFSKFFGNKNAKKEIPEVKAVPGYKDPNQIESVSVGKWVTSSIPAWYTAKIEYKNKRRGVVCEQVLYEELRYYYQALKKRQQELKNAESLKTNKPR